MDLRGRTILLALTGAMLVPGAALAHHSFAAFFDPSKIVTITGTVIQFSFTNPHGMIVLNVKESGGSTKEWRVETNAPVVLMRRGWSRDVLKPGETITVDGWPSRDGRAWLRLRSAKRADGAPIGVPFGQGDV
jgi:hypothetical protein